MTAYFRVNGYPTLKIFKNGDFSADYNGPREADGIVKYMLSKAGPSSRELLSVADAEKFLSHPEHSVIGFFAQKDSALAGEFLKVADQLAEDFRFAHSYNAQVLAKYAHSNEIVVFQPPRLQVKLEPVERVLTGKTASQLKQNVEETAHGIVGHRTPANAKYFKQPL